jgi:hypothetical protein
MLNRVTILAVFMILFRCCLINCRCPSRPACNYYIPHALVVQLLVQLMVSRACLQTSTSSRNCHVESHFDGYGAKHLHSIKHQLLAKVDTGVRYLILFDQILRMCRQTRLIAATVAMVFYHAEWHAVHRPRSCNALTKKR